jgi:hypothetical protein
VQQFLGHAHLDHTDDYIDSDPKMLEAMFTSAL